MFNTSQNNPDTNGILSPADSDGGYETGAADIGDLAGESGSGRLSQLRLNAPAKGVATVKSAAAVRPQQGQEDRHSGRAEDKPYFGTTCVP